MAKPANLRFTKDTNHNNTVPSPRFHKHITHLTPPSQREAVPESFDFPLESSQYLRAFRKLASHIMAEGGDAASAGTHLYSNMMWSGQVRGGVVHLVRR